MSVERGSRQSYKIPYRVILPGYIAIAVGMIGVGADSMVSPSLQAKAEHPFSITLEQYNAFKRYVIEYQDTVVRLADEGRYGEIPSLAEAPELGLARRQLADYKVVEALRAERREQIIADEFMGPSLVTRGRVYLAASVVGVLELLTVIPVSYWMDRMGRNDPPQIPPIASI